MKSCGILNYSPFRFLEIISSHSLRYKNQIVKFSNLLHIETDDRNIQGWATYNENENMRSTRRITVRLKIHGLTCSVNCDMNLHFIFLSINQWVFQLITCIEFFRCRLIADELNSWYWVWQTKENFISRIFKKYIINQNCPYNILFTLVVRPLCESLCEARGHP